MGVASGTGGALRVFPETNATDITPMPAVPPNSGPGGPGRPSSDSRRYRILTPEAYAAALEAQRRAPSPPPDWYLIVLGRGDATPTNAAVETLAGWLGVDAYTARQRLLLGAPQPLRRSPTRGNAEAEAAELRTHGLNAFVVAGHELEDAQPIPLVFLAPGPHGLDGETADGTRDHLDRERILAIVRGELTDRTATETTVRDPLLSQVRTERTVNRHETRLVLDLHLAGERHPRRIDAATFQFHRLYPERQQSTNLMGKALFDWLRETFPHAPVRDEFQKAKARLLAPGIEVAARPTELHTRLLPGPLQARTAVAEGKTISESDDAAFHLYSLLCRFEALYGRPVAR